MALAVGLMLNASWFAFLIFGAGLLQSANASFASAVPNSHKPCGEVLQRIPWLLPFSPGTTLEYRACGNLPGLAGGMEYSLARRQVVIAQPMELPLVPLGLFQTMPGSKAVTGSSLLALGEDGTSKMPSPSSTPSVGSDLMNFPGCTCKQTINIGGEIHCREWLQAGDRNCVTGVYENQKANKLRKDWIEESCRRNPRAECNSASDGNRK